MRECPGFLLGHVGEWWCHLFRKGSSDRTDYGREGEGKDDSVVEAIKSGFKINLFIYLFIFGCVVSSLRCVGFSLQWLLLLQSVGSRHVGFSSCGTQAQ